jgi:hypothetical protein
MAMSIHGVYEIKGALVLCALTAIFTGCESVLKYPLLALTGNTPGFDGLYMHKYAAGCDA